VTDTVTPETDRKRDWTLSPGAFKRFLEWLDEGIDSGGEKYLEMRRRLVSYFDRKNCSSPHELADETLNRVARRLEEEGEISTTAPARYCYTLAKFVFLEHLRSFENRQASLSDVTTTSHPSLDPVAVIAWEESRNRKELMLECLETCLNSLDEGNRDLISQYYQGEQRQKIENRRALAARLGLTSNALSIRACRVREKLESCVTKCCGKD
jgi:DNA-directed RNA polymerase specialized sigma24 family protein